MFSFIKKILRKVTNERTKEIEVTEVTPFTKEVIATSLNVGIVRYKSIGAFKKDYRCIEKFNEGLRNHGANTLTHSVIPISDLKENQDSILDILKEVGLIKLAKQYTILKCKGPEEFDEWMKDLSQIV